MSDLRTPSGYFFALLGVLLLGHEAIAPARAPLTNVNVNLYVGICMLIFGGTLLWLARRSAS